MNPLKENERESSKEKERENLQLRPRPRTREEDRQWEGFMVQAGDSAWSHGFTTRLLVESAKRIGMSRLEVEAWLKFMDEVDWTFTNGHPVSSINFRRSMRMWHVVEAEKHQKRRCVDSQQKNDYDQQREKQMAERIAKAKDPAEWELCAERCANCDGSGCPRFSIPPQLRERAIPPEECVGFIRRA